MGTRWKVLGLCVGLAACTHDFDIYEPQGDAASDGSAGRGRGRRLQRDVVLLDGDELRSPVWDCEPVLPERLRRQLPVQGRLPEDRDLVPEQLQHDVLQLHGRRGLRQPDRLRQRRQVALKGKRGSSSGVIGASSRSASSASATSTADSRGGSSSTARGTPRAIIAGVWKTMPSKSA